MKCGVPPGYSFRTFTVYVVYNQIACILHKLEFPSPETIRGNFEQEQKI